MNKWKLTDLQTESILNLRLRFLRRLEEQLITNEKNTLELEINEINALLISEPKLLNRIDQEVKSLNETLKNNKNLSNRRTLVKYTPVETYEDIEASIDEAPFTFVLSKNNWIQLVKGHENTSSIKYKEGDEKKFILLVKNTDKLLLASNSGRVFTLSLINLDISKGFGSPIRLLIDLPSEDIIVAVNIYNENKKLLVAATNNKGFLIPNMKSLLAQTKLGKNVLEISKNDNLTVFKVIEDDDDHIAIIGENHKLLIFTLSELPLQSKGKGVILQKVKQGELSDAKTFKYDEGLTYVSGNSKKVFKDLKLWLGKRAQSGRLAPRGFPRSNRFN